MVYPLPLAVAAEIVTLDPPELVRVPDKFVLLPIWTFPKARLAGFPDNAPCVTPLPDVGMLMLGSDPWGAMATLPLEAALVVGSKVTVNDVLWPAFKVNGRESPLMV